MSATPDTPLTLEQAFALAQTHWNAGRTPQAEQLCRNILAVHPQQPDTLNLLALMAHAYGKLDTAINFLRLAAQAPGVAPTYLSNLAEMCRHKGLLSEAEQAAQRAVALDPNLAIGWGNLGIILQESGQLTHSLDCLKRFAAMQPDSPQAHNNLANTYRRLNRLDLAHTHYRQALTLDPHYAEAHSNLAFLFSAQGQFEHAVQAARRAIELNPRLPDAYLNLAEAETSCLRHAQALHWLDALHQFAPHHVAGLSARAQLLKKTERHDEALVAANTALELAPDNANAHLTLGLVLQALNRHDEALKHFDRAAELPGTVTEQALVARATLLQESGRKAQAHAAFDTALAAFPGSIAALTARTESKRYSADDSDIATMQAHLQDAQALVLNDQLTLHFALAKAYLDIADSPRAFHHLNTGNALKRATFAYEADASQAWMQRIAERFPAERYRQPSTTGAPSSLPVFVLGMPRSGTTLVEQILASHPQVHGAGELAALRHAIEHQGTFPDSSHSWSAADLQQIGERYLQQVEPLADGRTRLVDKMPSNFLYAALIPLILPGARIIHCRRDPVDTCLSCYSKQFGGDQLFSYNLDELGRFHRDYQALMAHLRQVLPAERFIEVDYEAVVDDLEGQARRLIEFIDLPWNDACLTFHTTERVVRTASVNQVRQPIYTHAKGRWRAHAEHLGPLLDALGLPRQRTAND